MIVDVCEVYVKVISQEGRGGWVNFQANECIPSDSVVEVVCSAN